MASRADRFLTNGQIDCLELISKNLTSKEIAARLGISPHTVDQRVRKALRKLGVGTRREAARLVEDGKPRSQSLPEEMVTDPTVASEDRNQPDAGARLADLPLPFATEAQPTNRMGIPERIGWIVAIAVAAFASSGMYLAGLESLSRLLRH